MRVLHLLSSPSAGGAEIYVRDLAKESRRQGVECHIGFLGHAVDVGRSPDFEQRFLAQLSNDDIPYFFLGNECRVQLWKGAWRTRQYCKAHEIDIYHSHLMYGIFYGACLATPRLYTHHNIIPKAGKYGYAFFNRLVDQYVGISKVCAERLAASTGREVATIFNGADATKFSFASNRVSGTRLKLIAVGGLCEQKNYPLLINSIASLAPSVRNRIQLRICGEGSQEYSEFLNGLVRKHELQDAIIFLGNRSDVPELLAASDLFVMSSAWEGLPISLIEASLSGLACLVTDVGGCREVIEVCKNGLVCSSPEKEVFSSLLSRFVLDEEFLESCKANSRENAKRFSINNAWNQHFDLYLRLQERLQGNAGPRI